MSLVDNPEVRMTAVQAAATRLLGRAPSSLAAGQSYAVDFECTLSDPRFQLAGARIYAKGPSVYLVADFERLTGGLVARTRRNLIRATIPPGALASGRYRVTLPGQGESKSWVVQVH